MRVRVLPESLVAKIAAGEVVERPASIVKELVENSLDAGSRRIAVGVEAGGKKRIRVADDGHGMTAAEAAMALQRHATSKIRCLQDLETLSTLGFRGEALPSIAAVSRLRLRTATGDADAGVRLEVDNGRVVGSTEVSAPRGTTVEVEGLFEQIPVRRKFLRSVQTELAHITDLMNRFALSHPNLDFRLQSEDRVLLEAPPVADLHRRARQVYGDRFADSLVAIRRQEGDAVVRGLVSRPDVDYSSRSRQILFVNLRQIRDRTLSHAIHLAYQRILPPRRFPAVLLFLEMPAEEVDVNVHPAKTEVRFREPNRIHGLVRDGIREALAVEKPFAPLVLDRGAGPEEMPLQAQDRLREVTEAFFRDRDRSSSAAGESFLPTPDPGLEIPKQMEIPGPAVLALAQYRDSFIIGCDDEGLLVVDQHAAHERILYERYVAGIEKLEPDRQRLLFPRPLELTATQMVAYEAAAEELVALGYRLEPFGGRGLLVREVPALVDLESVQSLLADLLTEAGRDVGRLEVGSLREKLAVTTACHAAVKIHQPLGRERMDYILRELFQTSRPMTCPHGRPAVLRLTHEELLTRFRRR